MNVKKNQENKKLEHKKLDKKTFKRINDKFRQYWKYLFWLITIYIICYLIWRTIISQTIKDSQEWWMFTTVAIIQGLLFALDGWVTALLKSPFNQMCFAVNKTDGIDNKTKDYIINKATESNEHCKETLKKFGILTIGGELIKIFIKGQGLGDRDFRGTPAEKFEKLLFISYFIPLFFAAIDIYLIRRELKKIKKVIDATHGGK